MTVTAVIPARYASTRLPGKPLAQIDGRPMIQWVYERVGQASSVDDTIVATDDRRIFDAVGAFGGAAVMTSPDHPSGTDRLAEVAKNLDSEIIVNVQGDEPLIDAAVIDAAIRPMVEGDSAPVVTAATPIKSREDVLNPDVVKVVIDGAGYALYFSRSPIPHDRDVVFSSMDLDEHPFWKHIGLYVFRKEFLLRYSRMARTPLEMREKLEQLRILEHGHRIRVVETAYDSLGVDSMEDLERIRKLVSAGAGA